MRKSILRAFVFLAALAAAPAFAAQIDASTTIGSLTFAPSSKVHVKVVSAATGYVAESLHEKGSRVFGTDSVESKIYWRDATIGTVFSSSFSTTFTAPTSSSAHGVPDVSGSTWTAM